MSIQLMRSQFRVAAAGAMLLITAIFLQARRRNEVFPPRQALSALPNQLGNWTGSDVAIAKDVLDVLGSGDFLLRDYQNTAVREPQVDLFVAYFPSQRTGDTIHSPKNCLPGAGWSPVESSKISLSLPGQSPFPANRYVITKGDDRSLVLYWYWAHNRGVASEYWAKFYLVVDSIRLNRSDGALVRVTTPLRPGESPDTAQQRLLSLVGEFAPILNNYIPQ